MWRKTQRVLELRAWMRELEIERSVLRHACKHQSHVLLTNCMISCLQAQFFRLSIRGNFSSHCLGYFAVLTPPKIMFNRPSSPRHYNVSISSGSVSEKLSARNSVANAASADILF